MHRIHMLLNLSPKLFRVGFMFGLVIGISLTQIWLSAPKGCWL